MTLRQLFRPRPAPGRRIVPVRGGTERGPASRPALAARTGLALGLAGLTVVAAAAPAKAQSLYERNANIPVGSRPHPEFDALGVRLGAFLMYPRLSVSAEYDDNVYGLPQKTSDVLATLAPSVEFASNWSRHAVDLRLRYQRDQYFTETSQSSNEYALAATGRIDVDHASAITLTFNAARLTEARTSAGSSAALARPVQFDQVIAGVAGYRESGRFRLDVDLTSSDYRFRDTPLIGGGVYPESLRDETAYRERLRLSYATSPNLAAFVEVTPNQFDFKRSIAIPAGPVRVISGPRNLDSSGYSVLGGVNLQLTHLLTGDIGLGYLRQDYKDPSLGTVAGLAVNADARYFPTQLVTVTFHGDHSIQPSGVPGTPATNADNARLSADYELLRNLIISPQLSISRLRYPGADRVDRRYGAVLSGSYLVNRILGLTLSYNYLKQTSRGVSRGFSFDDNRLSLTLTLQR